MSSRRGRDFHRNQPIRACGTPRRILKAMYNADDPVFRGWMRDAQTIRSGVLSVLATTRPHQHMWVSPNGLECHLVTLWRGGAFDDSWSQTIYDSVCDLCFGSGQTRARQRRPFQEVCDRFFLAPKPGGRRDVLNVVCVTPTRLPKDLWPSLGREVVTERAEDLPEWLGAMENNQRVKLSGLASRVEIPLTALRWSRRNASSSGGMNLVRSLAMRRLGGRPTLTYRLFEADEETEQLEVLGGAIPALWSARTAIRGHVRTHAPMVQLMRIEEGGMVDLLMLETIGDSGEIIDIRWGRNRLDTIVLPDPYYAAGMVATLENGKRLCHP